VARPAELPIGAMPIGDITAVNAAGTADRLKPRSHVVGNVVPLAIVEGRRRRDQRSKRKSESHRRSRQTWLACFLAEMATARFGEEHLAQVRFGSHQMPGTSRHRTRAA